MPHTATTRQEGGEVVDVSVGGFERNTRVEKFGLTRVSPKGRWLVLAARNTWRGS